MSNILRDFPAHQYRTNWQSRELQTLKDNLPANHCICMHDFSENYRCVIIEKIQSDYYQKAEVSLHVTVIHKYPVLEYDMVEENGQSSPLISELFYVKSNDLKHDHHFTRQAQMKVQKYLRSINYTVECMHEFTDGCSSQYKSRHRMGASTLIPNELGYNCFMRIYFETSHAKGPQDAAGGLVKRQLDPGVLHGVQIQSAKDAYEQCAVNL